MKRIMVLALAPLIALALAGAAMIGVTLAITGDGGDAMSPGDIGITETATSRTDLVGEGGCWTRSTRLKLGLVAEYGAAGPNSEIARPLGWWVPVLGDRIHFCNSSDDIRVNVRDWGSQEWIPNVLPDVDALPA